MTELPPWLITIELRVETTLLAVLAKLSGLLDLFPLGTTDSPAPERADPDVDDLRTRDDWVTPERQALFMAMVGAGKQWGTTERALNKLPGLPVPAGALKRYARRSGIRMPMSDARRAACDRMRSALTAKPGGGQAATPAPSATPPVEPAVVDDPPVPVAVPPVRVDPAPAKPPAPVAVPRPATTASAAKPQLTRGDRGKGRHDDKPPILVDLAQLETWAAPRGITVLNWDDLPRVNAKREELGQTRFARKFTRSGR